MHLHPAVAPIKAAILPLTKKQSDKAMEVYSMLAQDFNVEFDVAGQIGKDIVVKMPLEHHSVLLLILIVKLIKQ